MPTIRPLIFTIVAVFVAAPLQAADSAVELSRLLPAESNTVSVVRVARILESPRAMAEGWADAAEEDFLSGASRIPPWVDTLVIGSLVRPAVRREVWSAAVLELPRTVTMERLAHREEARVEKLSGLRAVRGRRDAMLVEIRPRLLGVRSPAVRQEAARWARSAADNTSGSISPYLQAVVANPAHIVLGIDLRDMADPQRVRNYLEQSGLMPKDPIARVNLPQLLNTLQGVSFFATVDEATTARVVIEFDGDASKLGVPVAAVFRGMINDLQMSLDEFEDAAITARGNTVTLTMALSDVSLRRVVSLVTAPSPAPRANDEAIPSEPIAPDARPPRVDVELAVSRRYFRSVSQAIDDLARASNKAKEYARTATWHDNFARKIEQLSTAGVDAELLDWGRRVSERFRALAASLRGQGVQVGAQQQTLVYDVDYRPGWVSANWWGAVGYGESSVKISSNLQQVRERQATAVVKGAQQRITIWKLITDDRTAIENLMREKHGDGFFQRRR